jgi:predicted nucleic acid-binding protein
MKYLFDVNALVALGFLEHEFHLRVARWVSTSTPSIATCSITELGFVRVLAQALDYGLRFTTRGSYSRDSRQSMLCNLRFFPTPMM